MFALPGGNEDNDLWVTVYEAGREGGPALGSVWVPSTEEREAIGAGQNVELIVWGTAHPPVSVRTTDAALGKSA